MHTAGLERLHNIEMDWREWFTKDGYEIAQSFEENPWTDQNSTEASVDF